MVTEGSKNRDSETTVRSALALVAFVAACSGVAFVGSSVTTPSIPGWYENLVKPSFTPPNWLFGPMWTVLYLAMAVAGWLVSGQLVLNALWSVLFFGLQSPGAALTEILILWAIILATLLSFRRISEGAGWLLAPYLTWVTFAAMLNFEIWRLNS